jgi:hypothetical protein
VLHAYYDAEKKLIIGTIRSPWEHPAAQNPTGWPYRYYRAGFLDRLPATLVSNSFVSKGAAVPLLRLPVLWIVRIGHGCFLPATK